MDRIFFEETTKPGLYRVAAVDKHRIFSAQNPGTLATVFECSSTDHEPSIDAQIFYAFSSSINGDDFFADLRDNHRTQRLNTWSINVKNADIANLFSAVSPLDRSGRLELYTKFHSITPSETITSTSMSLFSLVAFAEKQSWKTGILQRCIDRLVLPAFRNNSNVYAVIDEEYRRIMRFKIETESHESPTGSDSLLVIMIRRIINLLGLQHSRDTQIFTTIPDSIKQHLKFIRNPTMIPVLKESPSIKDTLSEILFLWCGSRIVDCDGGYKLQIDSNVTEGLSYMQQLLPRPKILSILETQM
jgi:hypothetical protein